MCVYIYIYIYIYIISATCLDSWLQYINIFIEFSSVSTFTFMAQSVRCARIATCRLPTKVQNLHFYAMSY